MIRFRPLPILTLFAIAAFGVLMFFGRWQWTRYQEKLALAGAPSAEMTLVNYQPLEDGVQLVAGVGTGGLPGWRVFAPVRYGDDIVFVDSDFIPMRDKAPNWREVRYPSSLSFGAPVAGAPIRPNAAPAFTPPSDPLHRRWTHVDLAAMGRTSGLEPVADYYLAIPYLGEDGRAEPNPFAKAAGSDALPPARHLGYALTWWGLAAVLLTVYFAYHVNAGRLSFTARRQDEADKDR